MPFGMALDKRRVDCASGEGRLERNRGACAELAHPLECLEVDASVLREPFLGDVESRHDFQAADDCCLKTIDFGRCWLKVQDSVDAISNRQTVGLRLDVNIAGACLNGFQQDFVHQADNGGFLRHLAQFAAVCLDALNKLNFLLRELDSSS